MEVLVMPGKGVAAVATAPSPLATDPKAVAKSCAAQPTMASACPTSAHPPFGGVKHEA
jgi:hypothetical protein